jgi:hypothetical protein
MSLPDLKNWTRTTYGLHRGVLLLGAIQRLTQPPQPAFLELGLQVRPHGLATGRLPSGGQVSLNLETASLIYTPNDGAEERYPLNGSSQTELFTDLFLRLARQELVGVLPPGETMFKRVSAGIAARHGRYRPPNPETLLDETSLEIDLETARAYQEVVEHVFTGIARFRARLLGVMTPVTVWPHGFDLSTLWFTGKEIDESQPHMNFGFSPHSGGIDHPYLYAYAYPYPEKYEPPVLPEGARWHTQGWTGMVLSYGVIARQPDSMNFIESSCETLYQGLLPLITN